MSASRPAQSAVPSVDRVINHPEVARLVEPYGRQAVLEAVREDLSGLREALAAAPEDAAGRTVLDRIAERIGARLRLAAAPSLRPVFNLAGVLLHTNLGRAVLPEAAVEAMAGAARRAVALEFDLDSGRRGERDRHLEPLLTKLTGAEKATAVNNNAAAVLLALNTLGLKREFAHA